MKTAHLPVVTNLSSWVDVILLTGAMSLPLHQTPPDILPVTQTNHVKAKNGSTIQITKWFHYGRPMEYGMPLYFCPVVSSFFFSLLA